MNKEAYRLANEIQTDLLADGDCLMGSPREQEMEIKRYEMAVLNKIQQEKAAVRKRYGKMTAAAVIINTYFFIMRMSFLIKGSSIISRILLYWQA